MDFGEHLDIPAGLTTRGVAQRLGIAERTVHSWRSQGKLPAIKIAERVWIYPITEVERIEAERNRPAVA